MLQIGSQMGRLPLHYSTTISEFAQKRDSPNIEVLIQ